MEKTLQLPSWLTVSAGNADDEVWSQAGTCSSGLYPLLPPPFPRQSTPQAPTGDGFLKKNLFCKPLSPYLQPSDVDVLHRLLTGDLQQLAAAFHLLLNRGSSLDLPPSLSAAVHPLNQLCTAMGEVSLPLLKIAEKCIPISADFALVWSTLEGGS